MSDTIFGISNNTNDAVFKDTNDGAVYLKQLENLPPQVDGFVSLQESISSDNKFVITDEDIKIIDTGSLTTHHTFKYINNLDNTFIENLHTALKENKTIYYNDRILYKSVFVENNGVNFMSIMEKCIVEITIDFKNKSASIDCEFLLRNVYILNLDLSVVNETDLPQSIINIKDILCDHNIYNNATGLVRICDISNTGYNSYFAPMHALFDKSNKTVTLSLCFYKTMIQLNLNFTTNTYKVNKYTFQYM